MSANDEPKRYLCKACNGWINGGITGKWVDGWFLTTCPHCLETLATQTPWFELRPLSQVHNNPWELTNGQPDSTAP